MKKLKLLSYVLMGLILVCSFASAQQGTSKITGIVTDNENTPLPGVSVVAKSPALVGQETTVTDATGTFRLLALNPGVYTLTFSLQAFKTKVRENIIVGIEQTIALGNIILEVGSLEEQITVIGQSPLIDVKSSMKAVTLNKEVFQTLPKGRNFAELMTVLPGVNYESRQGGYSVDGGSGSENMFYVDGTDTTNSRSGTQGQTVITDFLEEVQVKASGYNAEFGGSLGGVVNVVTRSGGNEFHGDVMAYLTGRSLNTIAYDTWRYDPLSTTVPPAVEWYNEEKKFGKDPWFRIDGVISLGGYILKDRLWFFGSFNPQYYKYERDVLFIADPEKKKRHYYTYSYNTDAQLKLTSQVTKNLRVSVSGIYNLQRDRRSLPARAGTGSMTTPYEKTGYSYPGSSGTGSLDYTLGNNVLISLRGGWWYINTTDQLLKAPGTLYSFSRSNVNLLDVPAAYQHASGWSSSALSLYEYKKYIRSRQYANLDLTYYLNLAGEHAWKAGVQWVRLHDDLDQTYLFPAVYLYWNDAYTYPATGEKVQGKYGYYNVNHSFSSAYGRNGNISTGRWSVYVQDSWTIKNRLTINLGVRAEDEHWPIYSQLPAYKGKDIFHFTFKDKISPRLSVVYDLFGDSSLKLYASVSRIYDVMKTYAAEESYGGFSWINDFYTLDTYEFTKIASSGDRTKTDVEKGGTLIGSYNMRWFNLDTTDMSTKPVSKDELSFGFDKRVSEEIIFTTRVVYDNLNYIIEDCGWSVPTGELYITGNPGYGMMLPQSKGGLFPNEFFPMPQAKRKYWGINLNVEKRFSNNWAGGVNYTLSWLWGNCSGLANSYAGDSPTRPGATRAFDSWTMMYDAKGNTQDTWLYTDRRHYFKAYGTYRFPFGVTVGARAYLMTGLPYQAMMSMKGYPFFPYGWATDRYPFERWLDVYLEYNLKVLGKFNIQLNANIDNLLQMHYVTSTYYTLTYRGAYVTDAVFTSKQMDVASLIQQYIPHPVYGKENGWLSPRRSTRLGMKISW